MKLALVVATLLPAQSICITDGSSTLFAGKCIDCVINNEWSDTVMTIYEEGGFIILYLK